MLSLRKEEGERCDLWSEWEELEEGREGWRLSDLATGESEMKGEEGGGSLLEVWRAESGRGAVSVTE